MKEQNNPNQFSWLTNNYGVDFASLDPQTQKLVQKLGPEGVAKLVSESAGTMPYRGRRITQEERNNALMQIQQLFESSNDPRFVGPASRKVKNKPSKWAEDEITDLVDI